MCISCTRVGQWLPKCLDRRGPGTPSPPNHSAGPVQLSNLPQVPREFSVSRGSSVRSARSGHSMRSSGTGISEASAKSIDSTTTINSVHSLLSLVRHISQDLYPQERLVASLRSWLATVDPGAYKREHPWPPVVLAAYNEYKRLAEVQGREHTAFEKYVSETNRNTTPEQHLQRARLAVTWGEAAVRVAEGRLSFIETYRNAYSSTHSIETHIKSGKEAIESGRNAVREARTNYQKLFEKYMRAANPQVFE